MPVTYGTADVALRHRCQLQKGQTVLVLGASGGVGVAAVQIAKVVGAQVIAVSASQHLLHTACFKDMEPQRRPEQLSRTSRFPPSEKQR